MVQDSSEPPSSKPPLSSSFTSEPLVPARLVESSALSLVDMRQQTKLADNRMPQLWQQFRPRCNDIPGADLSKFYNLKNFGKGMDWDTFSPQTAFEHWAAIALRHQPANNGKRSGELPSGMELFELESGSYAVFIYQGLPSGFPAALNAIFAQWLPASGFQLDDRPHFEVLTQYYRPDDPNASEEIWVPIAPRL